MNEFYSDRSTCVTEQKCPRLRWYSTLYPHNNLLEVNAPGVVPDVLDINLTLGSAFHVGIFHLLNGVGLEETIGRVLEGDTNGWEGYWPMVRKMPFRLEEGEDTSYVYFEQAAMVEALIRGYYYFALPKLLDTYEVLETEYDEQAYFSDPTVPDFRLRWGIRTDGLLRDKQTDNLFILSLKTAKEWDRNKEENNRTDMQGLTEMGAVEQRLKRWHEILTKVPSDILKAEDSGNKINNESNSRKVQVISGYSEIPMWFVKRFLDGGDPVIAGVKMEFALKGYRSQYPKGSGLWVYSNPLIRPYKRADDLYIKKRSNATNSVVGDYAFSWNFTDDLGANHTLGKGWRTINIWEDMGVKNWIEYVMENSIQGFQPGYAIEKQFVLPIEYTRDEQEVKRKIRQIVNQEYKVSLGAEKVIDALHNHPEDYIEQLDIHFQQRQDYPHSCSWCSHKTICLGLDSYKFDPLSHPGFIPRTSNHQKAELIQIGG